MEFFQKFFLLIVILSADHASGEISRSTPKKCSPNEHWVRTHVRRAYIRSDGTHVSSSKVIGHCRENSAVYSIWRNRIRNGVPVNWERKGESGANWSDDEIEAFLEALAVIPDQLTKAQVINVYRARKSTDHPNPASSSDGIIVFYNSAFDRPTNLSRVLAHELAHQKYRDLNDEERKNYWTATNWFNLSQDDKHPAYIRRKDGYVEADGKISPEEDFANNVEYFLFDKEKLHRASANASDWINKHFGDTFILEGRRAQK